MSDNPTPCQRCGEPHARCSGHRRDGRPCTQAAMQGQRVCRMHGGSSPQALAAVERRQQEQAAEAAVVTFGLPREMDPGDALLEAVHAAAGHVGWLRQLVGELQPGELKQLDASGKFERPAVWVELYGEWMDRLARVSKAALDAGVAERLVRNAERLAFAQALGVESFVRGVVERLGLSWDDEVVRAAVVGELEAGEVGA